jgi:hypothetical protein
MENKKFGLIPGIECKFVKTDPSIIEALAKKTETPIEQIKCMMRYNMFTVNQFSQLACMPISTVTNKTRPAFKEGEIDTELDWCFPFQDKENEGPKFILRNEKSEKYLRV